MPFVEMPEGVSMFYRFRPASSSRTRSECADLEINSSTLDPAAPLLVSFSPWSVDGSYLIDRLAGPELAGWSLVVFDLRNHGQTCAPACPEFDFFVAGADIALAMAALHLGPAHIYAVTAHGFQIAVALALLFPSQVRTLSLAGISNPDGDADDRGSSMPDLSEFVRAVAGSEDFIEIITNTLSLSFGTLNGETPEQMVMLDAYVHNFITLYGANELARTLQLFAPTCRQTFIPTELWGTLTMPILIMQGSRDVWFAPEKLPALTDRLTGAEVQLHIIDGPTCIYMFDHPKILPYLVDFLTPRAFLPPPATTQDPLALISLITHDPTVLARNPAVPTSYSSLSDVEKKSMTMWIQDLLELQAEDRILKVEGPIHENWKWSRRGEDQTNESGIKAFVPAVHRVRGGKRSTRILPLSHALTTIEESDD